MSEPTRNRWRGVPADARAAERRALLVETGFELLGNDGIAGTTVRKVCEAARLNPRYFYESFEDLDALLLAVFERTAQEAVAAILAAVAGVAGTGDEDLLVRTAIGAAIRHVTGDPRRTRVLFMEGLNNEALGLRRFDLLNELASAMVADGQRRSEELLGGPAGDGDRPPSILVVAANLLIGGMAELLMSYVTGRLDVTLDELEDDTTALFRIIIQSVEQIITHQHPRDGSRG